MKPNAKPFTNNRVTIGQRFDAAYLNLCSLLGSAEAADRELQRFVSIHGDGHSSHTRAVTAAHEAGHVLVGHLAGFKPRQVSIEPYDKELWLGGTTCKDRGSWVTQQYPDRSISEIFLTVAGFLGETVFAKHTDPGSSADEKVTSHYMSIAVARVVGTVPQVLYAAIIAQVISSLEQHRHEGEVIQRALMQRRKLNRCEIKRLLRNVSTNELSPDSRTVCQLIRMASNGRTQTRHSDGNGL